MLCVSWHKNAYNKFLSIFDTLHFNFKAVFAAKSKTKQKNLGDY